MTTTPVQHTTHCPSAKVHPSHSPTTSFSVCPPEVITPPGGWETCQGDGARLQVLREAEPRQACAARATVTFLLLVRRRSTARAEQPCTSGPTPARSRTDARCAPFGSAEWYPHGREAVRMLDVPPAVQRQEPRCAAQLARAEPHGREAVRLLDAPPALNARAMKQFPSP